MPRKSWNGRRVTNAIQYVITRDHGQCWLCHHPGANSLDHVLPVATHPQLEWDPSNWRASHLGKAGTIDGCQAHGCNCIGNRARRANPHTAPPSRSW